MTDYNEVIDIYKTIRVSIVCALIIVVMMAGCGIKQNLHQQDFEDACLKAGGTVTKQVVSSGSLSCVKIEVTGTITK